MEEFEPITPDNIHEVLKYNGFHTRGDNWYMNNKMVVFICHSHYWFRTSDKLGYEPDITHNDLNKVLDFMKEFIELKPLPKTPVFDARQFLLDNGFYEYYESYPTSCFGHSGLTIELNREDNELELRDGRYIEATPKNLQTIVEAAKILKGLE